MTAQLPDKFLRNGASYALIAVETEWPFSPKQHGFQPVAAGSACWRGYVCEYALRSAQLVLDSLYVSLGTPPPVWRNIAPSEKDYWEHFRLHKYAGVELPIAYSGRMVIADDFLREYYIHMGFQRAYAYREVIELTFDEGTLLAERDHSAAMEEIRQMFQAADAELPRPRTKIQLEEFVRNSFSTSYADKWFLEDSWP